LASLNNSDGLVASIANGEVGALPAAWSSASGPRRREALWLGTDSTTAEAKTAILAIRANVRTFAALRIFHPIDPGNLP
jgi:hypothetical protein